MSRPLSSEYSLKLGFSFNINLGRNLEPYRNATLYQDFDAAVLVDGKEGSGKTVIAFQVATFLDKDNHLDLEKQVCFTPEHFKEAVQTLEKGKAIVWDEARRGLNRRRSTQDTNIEITDMLAECRQNNLFLVIVMPTFYDMDMNAAVWRTRLLIHVWYTWEEDQKNPKPLKRGYFRFYSEEGKKKLYTNKRWRQGYEYPYLKNDSFEGTFPHFYCVDEREYRKRKRQSESYYSNKNNNKKSDAPRLINWLVTNNWLKNGGLPAIAAYFGVSERTVRDWRKAAGARYNS